ncbi:MAG TPA: hypothetical protein VE715_03800 [Blastocatellia bacterium]|nr:hypothetical protein [Blastocatellia bacterium]
MDNDTQLAVFENDDESNNGFGVDQHRPRALLVAGAIAALMMGILIIALVITKPAADRDAENMVRAGSPEFDAYKDKVALEIDRDSRVVYDNWLGMWQLHAKAKLSNLGDRELTGVEVIGKMLDFQDNVISHTVGLPVPRVRQAPLKPGESMTIAIKVDAPQKVTEGEVKDITIELRGLRFR